MEIKFTKRDFWLAVLAGEIVAWLSLPTLKNLKALDLLIRQRIEFISFTVFWVLLIPTGAVFGLLAFYYLAKYKQRIGFFQLGKYGVIGVLKGAGLVTENGHCLLTWSGPKLGGE